MPATGLVTLTSQYRSLGGPPALVLMVAVMVLDSVIFIFDTLGVGPEPPSRETEAPSWKPDPVIVTSTEEPVTTELGKMFVTETPASTSLTSAVVLTATEGTVPSLTARGLKRKGAGVASPLW